MDWAKKALDECVDLVSVHDSYGVYLYANRSFERLLGYAPDELTGKAAYELIHPDDVDEVGKSHQDTLYDGQPTLVTYRIRRKDGGYEWVETTGRTVVDDDRGTIFTVTRPVGHRRPEEAKARLVDDPRRVYA